MMIAKTELRSRTRVEMEPASLDAPLSLRSEVSDVSSGNIAADRFGPNPPCTAAGVRFGKSCISDDFGNIREHMFHPT
jgi:hypothetical protein